MVKTFDYSRLTPELQRQNARQRIFRILVIAFGILPLIDCTYIEILNVRAGFELPFSAERLAEHHWRTIRGREEWYRLIVLKIAGDPEWETRPLTPSELTDFHAWARRINADSDLAKAVPSACLLIPAIPLLLIFSGLLFYRERSAAWRIVLAGIFLAQMASIAVFVHLQLLSAIGKAID